MLSYQIKFHAENRFFETNKRLFGVINEYSSSIPSKHVKVGSKICTQHKTRTLVGI